MDSIIQRRDGETYDDYFVRLFENKNQYNLNCEDIADILNRENGKSYGESKYRKEWAAFNRGRQYERRNQFVGVFKRILSLSDFHVPFQLPLDTFSEYQGIVDILQLNGDIVDMLSISKFSKAYRSSPMEEIIEAREYLIRLIKYIGPAVVEITYGNHEVRFENYLAKNIDTDLINLLPKTPLELIFNTGFHYYDKRTGTNSFYEPLQKLFPNVEINYREEWFCQIGQTMFCHPLAFSSGIMGTAEKAVSWFRNEGYDFTSLVMAHTHRVGEYTIGKTTIYEQGCLCDVSKMNYHDGRFVNSQKEGFIYICQDKEGHVIKDKTKLVLLN